MVGIATAGLSLLLLPGCSRHRYHVAADRDAYGVLNEKTGGRPWHLPSDYAIAADPRSRLYDATDPHDPLLPLPGPDLYAYQLPPLQRSSGPEPIPADGPAAPVESGGDELPPVVQPASASLRRGYSATSAVYLQPAAGQGAAQTLPYAETEDGLTIQPIPAAYWEALPPECLARMLEFESVRKEYERAYQRPPPDSLRDPAPKLTFSDIVELGYLNSRDYQRQKEILYSTALALTLERFDYMTKFSAFGNGVDTNFDHVRTGGTTVNSLAIPSSTQGDRMIALGGTFVSRFANNVLLTFNGPAGFAEDISSNMLFEFTQSVFQRDVLLNPLIQSERNVVYAGRNFARFRKQFFFNLAQTYYQDLLSTYRGIEIDTRNYFAFVRALDQAEAEVRSGVSTAPPRFQIDQIEQNMLGGRSRLISTCNSLETSLDRLKLTLGLPTETLINIDLRELESLTRRDESEVAKELIRRARERVVTQLDARLPDREEIVSASIVLLERLLNWLDLRQQEGQQAGEYGELRTMRAQLRVDEAYESLDRVAQQLAEMKTSVPPTAPINVFRGTIRTSQARLALLARQLQLSDELNIRTAPREVVLDSFVRRQQQTEGLLERLERFLQGDQEDLTALQADADAILQELETLDVTARQMLGAPDMRPDKQSALRQTLQQGQQLLETTDRLAAESQGLTPVDLTVDDAMVTALVQRFELMNERGFLADDWRGIKLAADDLKSVLNLNVRQSFQSRGNQPFDFSLDDSRTELRGSLDLPLNRRQQRNGYRQALINYQVGRRSLMALEDNIKFSARQDLRQLKLDRVQYDISVISAALASERVYSTQLELALGLGSITARDFLEAQQAYRASLSSVANGRLSYIVNRAQLALDLELMLLDDTGMWPELNNDEYQPVFAPQFPYEADPTYGDLPTRVWPSKRIKRMLNYPLPGYQVLGEPAGAELSEPVPLPPPME